VVKSEYIYLPYEYRPKLEEDDSIEIPMFDGLHLFYTERSRLPDWFSNAPLHFKKVIRVLGASAGSVPADYSDQEPLPIGIRLLGNIARDFPTHEFVMMINNYNCVKEYDVTHNNLQYLEWKLEGTHGFSPFYHNVAQINYIDMVVELELLLVDDNE
jgi:hypothetical protein